MPKDHIVKDISLAAFGRDGKPLGTIINEGAQIEDGNAIEFMGFESSEPVLMVKLYRMGEQRQEVVPFKL